MLFIGIGHVGDYNIRNDDIVLDVSGLGENVVELCIAGLKKIISGFFQFPHSGIWSFSL